MLAAVALATAAVPGAALAQDPPSFRAPFADDLSSRTFPLLAMLRSAEGWERALRDDPSLRTLARDRAGRTRAEACAPAPQCLAGQWLWTDADIAIVAERLRAMAGDPRLQKSLITKQLRPSQRFSRHAAADDTALLLAAWRDTAAALNHVVEVYAKGQPPRYPKIDSIIFDPAGPQLAEAVSALGVATAANASADAAFFEPSLAYALGLLRMNERIDAGRFRPLLDGENAAAVRKAKRTDWGDRPYTALLVFGHGPEDPMSRTGVMGHIRLGIAADLYRRGLAPFLIVSGGNVHPNRTPFNEAVEMKRMLVEDHGVPADRILIEPHARHTTTNLRNCARLLLAAGFPAIRPALVVSDHRTITYIGGAELAARNLREMGVQPVQLSPGPDRFTLRFLPDVAAFHVDAAADTLDP